MRGCAKTNVNDCKDAVVRVVKRLSSDLARLR
jgi:hypothetical protein